MKKLSRRKAIKLFLGSSSLLSTSLIPGLYPMQALGSGASSKKLLHIFLKGGWDSHLAIDPVRGTKKLLKDGGVFADQYEDSSHAVPGKSNLFVGNGLQAAIPALTNVPTCFINGMDMEITAHELAVNYMFSGVSSLSRSREYPALLARMGAAAAHFPPHGVLGGVIPLDTTKISAPPIFGTSISAFSAMLGGPYNTPIDGSMFDRAHALIQKLDDIRTKKLSEKRKNRELAWFASQSQLNELYAKNLGSEFNVNPEPSTSEMDALRAAYNCSNGYDQSSHMLGAYLIMRSGLTPFLTVSIDGFDTHSNHFSSHTSLMTNFAQQLNRLVSDMMTTDDPDQAGKKLIDTTNIIITSEFVRTPSLNATQGTDHWQSASAIVMGPGVADNRIIGATDDNARPLGWNGTNAEAKNELNSILPEHLLAAVLYNFGFMAEADELSDRRLDGVFA